MHSLSSVDLSKKELLRKRSSLKLRKSKTSLIFTPISTLFKIMLGL